MKKINLLTLVIFGVSINYVHAQLNSYPLSGVVNIGLPNIGGSANTFNTSNSNLHLHSMNCESSGSGGSSHTLCNYTTRLTLSNSLTGYGLNNGFTISLIDKALIMKNNARDIIVLETGSTSITMDPAYNRIHFGTFSSLSSTAQLGRFNYDSGSDNGIHLKTNVPGKYGLQIQTGVLTDNAIQVVSSDGTSKNFSVKSSGLVYARKYTTTLNNIPDYVFLPTYNLMSLTDLRTYAKRTICKRLPTKWC